MLVYLISNPVLGAGKVGIGSQDRVDTWEGRGWIIHELIEMDTREEAWDLEQYILGVVRDQGYKQFMPPGYDGYSETFAGEAIHLARDEMLLYLSNDHRRFQRLRVPGAALSRIGVRGITSIAISTILIILLTEFALEEIGTSILVRWAILFVALCGSIGVVTYHWARGKH